jgi:hypothetical protein
MADYFAREGAWVTEDGSYGVGLVIHFDDNAITIDDWETLAELRDNDRYDFIHALLNGEDVSEWTDN